MNLLFICNQGKHRSRTAAEMFLNATYAGIYSQVPVTEKEPMQADIIFVMEDHQRKKLGERFPHIQKRILNLDIPDVYLYRDERLKKIIKTKVEKFLSI